MKQNILIIFIFLIIISFGCNSKLLIPLENGIIDRTILPSVKNGGTNFYIQYNKSLKVIASENSVVTQILRDGENYIICAKGKYNIFYANLEKCFVKKGDRLKQSDLIGEIGETRSDLPGTDLIVNVQVPKTGIFIVDPKIFFH